MAWLVRSVPEGTTRTEVVLSRLMLGLAVTPLALRTLLSLGTALRRFRRPLPVAGSRKVLHVTCSFDLGGTQRQIINLCESRSDTPFVHEAIEIFPEQNYLYRRDARLDPARYTGTTPPGRAMGSLVMNMSARSAQSVQIYKLVKDFRALRPDVVVGWGHEMSALAFVAAAIARVPHIVFCIRTFNPAFGWTTPAMGHLLHRAHRRMHPLVSGTIANSTVVRADYAAWLGIPPGSVDVCPNGIRVEPPAPDAALTRARIRQEHGIPPDALVVCNVGRFSKEKGQRLMMDANRRLIARYGPAAPWWLLCGDGPLLDEIKGLAADEGMTNVRFAGRIDDVGAFLSAADIFVMPSDFEGMPNAMMEAMAHGLPSVSTSRSGAIDIARDGVEALYCPPGAADHLASHLMTLAESASERARLGQNARRRIEEFSIERGARAFDRCLQSLVCRPAPSDAAGEEVRHEVASATAKHGRGGPQ